MDGPLSDVLGRRSDQGEQGTLVQGDQDRDLVGGDGQTELGVVPGSEAH
jgi:hypothetical protein